MKRYGVYSDKAEYEAEGLEEVKFVKQKMRERGDKNVGHYEKEKMWIHKEPKWDIKKRRFMHKLT